MDWFKVHGANMLKAVALVITIGGGSITFFMDIKEDIAVLQSQYSEMNKTVDRIYQLVKE